MLSLLLRLAFIKGRIVTVTVHNRTGSSFKEVQDWITWELFYADDLALLAESEEELLEMIRQWKDGMEQKGLKVNMGKTKVMNCKVRQGQAENSGKFPCGICKKGV